MIDKYQNLIFSVCYRMTSDYFAAQDLTQETYLSAFKNIESYRDDNAKARLCRIASNKCIDYLRANKRTEPTESEKLDMFAAGGASTSEETEDRELKRQLEANCRKLKPPYDEIALAYFYSEKSPNEIASERGQNIKTVQTQIYRARAMLREMYSDMYQEYRKEAHCG